jgi:hypothetical protein
LERHSYFLFLALGQADQQGGIAASQETACAGKVEDGHIQQAQGAGCQVHILFLEDGYRQKSN